MVVEKKYVDYKIKESYVYVFLCYLYVCIFVYEVKYILFGVLYVLLY